MNQKLVLIHAADQPNCVFLRNAKPSVKVNNGDLLGFFKICSLLCVCAVVTLFFLSIFLVKTRQGIILSGRKIYEMEKSVAEYASKNSEVNAKISQLSSPRSLHRLIAKNGFVVAGAHNTVKISKLESHFYALNRSQSEFAHERGPQNFSKQTNLTKKN
jgi:cell division protein FtsL